jgi:probable F420-dependent oxidoreductase
VKYGLPLGLVHPGAWRDLAVAADELGFESVWLPEHLVFATDMSTDRYPGRDEPPIRARTPLFDAPAYLCALAAVTTRVRLGTGVYLLALRHPFVAARAFGTLDAVSGGRAIAGVGAGWYAGEWRAAGVDFATRGARLDEAIDVVRRLWTDATVAYEGRFFAFEEVAFEPRPVRPPPILVGGASRAALRRAARLGDGWISMPTTLDAVRPELELLRTYREEAGRAGAPFEVTVHVDSVAGPEEARRWGGLGVDRLIVRPWRRGRDATAAAERFADAFGLR